MKRRLAAILAISCVPAAAQACAWPVWRLSWGQPSTVLITAISGEPCATRINAGGLPVAEVRTLRRPTHGVLTVNTQRVTYEPKQGFVGADLFVFEVTGAVLARGRPMRAWVLVRAQVTAGSEKSD